jgi:hypothetical protein
MTQVAALTQMLRRSDPSTQPEAVRASAPRCFHDPDARNDKK